MTYGVGCERVFESICGSCGKEFRVTAVQILHFECGVGWSRFFCTLGMGMG